MKRINGFIDWSFFVISIIWPTLAVIAATKFLLERDFNNAFFAAAIAYIMIQNNLIYYDN